MSWKIAWVRCGHVHARKYGLVVFRKSGTSFQCSSHSWTMILREYYEVLISIGLRYIQIGSFPAYTNIQMYHPAEVIYIVHFFEHTRNECRFSSPPSAPLRPQLALRSLQTTMNRKPEAEKLFVSWPPRPEERRGKGRQSIRRRLRGRPGDGRYIYHGVNCILSLVLAV